jgi:hypothetical protein
MKYLLAFVLLLAGCGDNGPTQYLKISGGGIQFNYRYSQASMVVVAQTTHPLPDGSRIEAQFDLPGTNTRESVFSQPFEGKLSYLLHSQNMTGFTKGGKYNVSVLLLDKDGKELDRKETVFTSDEDQSTLPDKPMVEGLEFTPHLENIDPSTEPKAP